MKALCIKQPWAWLIVHGFKDVENRTWPTRFRGRFLVIASSRATKSNVQRIRERVRKEFHIEIPEELEYGGIVGEAELVDCVKDCPSAWFEGPFGFVLKNGKTLPFKPRKGQLNFFDVRYP